MKSTPQTMILSLTTLCMLAGIALAAVRSLTAAPIARAATEAQAKALCAVLPPFDNNPIAEACSTTGGLTIFPATLANEFSGAAVETFSDAGFSGRITLLVGFNTDGSISGYSVLQHNETPGLGAKMADWFRSPGSTRSILGTRSRVNVKQDGGNIDAISGATITSRAFIEAVNRARTAFEDYITTDRQ